MDGSLQRVTAFTTVPTGGNPAGVWVGEEFPPEATMQRIAADVGYSETAFVTPSAGLERRVRYFSPEKEISFCGHATIAAGVVLGNTAGDGSYVFHTPVGIVPVAVERANGLREAALTSVTPKHEVVAPTLLTKVLGVLGWKREEVGDDIPPARIYAGAWHLVLAARTRDRLRRLEYDFASLKRIMLNEDLTTLQLVWRAPDGEIHSRNPFPVGGVVEDPATGAAAAALGGYLRDIRLLRAPARLIIRQGEDMGRPSRLVVDVPVMGGITVRGTAVAMADA